MKRKQFIDDGFFVAEAKSQMSWIDENTVFIGSDFGDDTVDRLGIRQERHACGRAAYLWRKSKEVFAGEQADVAVTVYRGLGRRRVL